MRLLSLALWNVGPFPGEVHAHLDRQGLVSLLGDNQVDPGFTANDVGKSALIDALLWALYGETAPRKESQTSERGLGADDMVNDVVGKNALAVVTFEGVDGAAYRVRRWRKVGKEGVGGFSFGKPNGAALDVHRVPTWHTVEDLDSGNVQAAIDRALGLNHALAVRILVRSQEDGFSFVQATPKQRHDLLTEIEGHEELDAWHATFKEKTSAADRALAVLEAQIQTQRAQIEALKREHASLNLDAKIQEWEAQRAQSSAAARAALAQHDAQHDALRAAASAVPALAAKVEELRHSEAAVAFGQKPADVVAWERRVTDLAQAISVLVYRKGTAQQKLIAAESFLPGARCERCAQPITAEHLDGHRRELKSEMHVIDVEIQSSTAAHAEAQAVVAKGNLAWDEHVRALNGQRAAFAQQRGAVMMQLRAAEQAQAQLVGMAVQRSQLQKTIERAEASTNPWMETATRNAASLETKAQEIQKGEDERLRLSTEAGLLAWWVRAIPSIKAWLFDAACADITNQANRWLSIFTEGMVTSVIEATATTKAGEARDKIGLRFFRRGPDGVVHERDFRRFGGGLKRRVVMAVEWALAGRIQRRAKLACGFLALDEVDRHLDDAGRAGLMRALEVLKAEKETVVFVSHDPNLRAFPDKKWLVRKTAQGSTFEVIQ